MKRDMTGGAVVMAMMAALADVGCPVRVIGLVAAAENAISGTRDCAPATCCATTAAAPPRSPTPTPRAGWCWPTRWRTPSTSSSPTSSSTSPPSPAPSRSRSASRSAASSPTDDALADALLGRRRDGRASRCGGSRCSPATRTSSSRRSPTPTTAPSGPRAITAALFLQHFAGDVPWAHLDVASVGDVPDESSRVDRRADRLRCPRAARPGSAPTTRSKESSGEGSHRPLVARRRPRRRRGRAGDVRRRHLARPVHRHGRAALQDLAGAARASGSRAATSSRTDEARAEFQATFTAGAADAPGSQIIGSAPILIEECDVVAVAEGWEGFSRRLAAVLKR